MAAFSRMARPRNVALAAVLAANGVLAQNNCITLQGITDDGTQLNFLQVSSGGTDTYTAGFVDDETQATILGIDPTTGQMLDYTDGGRIANIDAGFDFDYLFFDYQAEMDQFDQLAVNCSTDTDGVLTCTAADNSAVNVFNYCDGVVALSNAVQPDFGCVGLTLVATDAGACPALPVTSTTTDTDTATSTDDSAATSTTTDAGVTTTETTTSVSTTTASGSSSTTSASSDLADPNTLSSTTTTASSGASTMDAGATTTTSSAALTTSTVFATNTVTVTEGDATSVSTSVYPLYTTVCPIGAPAPAVTGGYGGAAGGYGAGSYGAGGAGGYGAGGAAASAPVYNPAHLVALPATVCASQLNAVASKYPAGAMNSYSSYGYVPVPVGANTGAGAGGYGANNAAPTAGQAGYGAGNTGNTGNAAGNNAGYGAGAGNGASNNAAGNMAGNNAGNNAYGAGNNAAGNAAGNNAGSKNAGAGNVGAAGNFAGAANNGSVAGAAGATGTGAYKANPTAPMQYEGSASSVKMALGGVLAAAIALVALI